MNKDSEEEGLELRSNVSKSALKGTIAVAVFSLFLEVSPSNLANYFTFLAIFYAMLGVYALQKRQATYVVGESGITIAPWLRARRTVAYSSIGDLSVAQGLLARRFKCGTVVIVLKGGEGHARIVGGGTAEMMKDVPDPQGVVDEISSRLTPFQG